MSNKESKSFPCTSLWFWYEARNEADRRSIASTVWQRLQQQLRLL